MRRQFALSTLLVTTTYVGVFLGLNLRPGGIREIDANRCYYVTRGWPFRESGIVDGHILRMWEGYALQEATFASFTYSSRDKLLNAIVFVLGLLFVFFASEYFVAWRDKRRSISNTEEGAHP